MRYYTVSYDSSGTLISDRTELEYSTDTMVVSWNETKPGGTALTIQVSLNNGSTWISAVNGQLLELASSGRDLKYKFEFDSDGARTPVVRWIEISRSILDYGKNPSLLTDGSDIYLVYQPVSYNHALSKNITFANSTNGGQTWSFHSFPGSSVNENGIPKLVKNANGIHVLWLNTTGQNQGIRCVSTYDNGTTWSGTTVVATTKGICEEEDFALAGYGNRIALAYSSTLFDPYPIIYTKIGTDNGTSVTWSGAISQTANTSYTPQLAIDSLGFVYIAWDTCKHNIKFKITNETGESVLLDDTTVASGANDVTIPALALDARDSVHLSWREKAGTVVGIKYWNNTPTSATTIASTTNNYIHYLPNSAFTNQSVASGQRVSLMTAIQNDAQAIVGGLGELASNRLTYQDMTKIVSQGVSQVWVTSSYAGNVWSAGNNLKTTAAAYGTKPLNQLVIPVPGPIPANWNTYYLSRAYNWLTYGLGFGTYSSEPSWLANQRLEQYGSFDRYVWNGDILSQGNIPPEHSDIVKMSRLFDPAFETSRVEKDPSDPTKNLPNPLHNPGVNPYIDTLAYHNVLYALAWFFTHSLSWDDGTTIHNNDLYGSSTAFNALLAGFSYFDRSKESNLYFIKTRAKADGGWGENDVKTRIDNTPYHWYNDDWRYNQGSTAFGHIDYEYDASYGIPERFPSNYGANANCLGRAVKGSNTFPYATSDTYAFAMSDIADAWDVLTYKTPWNSQPFSKYKSDWCTMYLPQSLDFSISNKMNLNSWDTDKKYNPTTNSNEACNALSPRDMIYRDLKYVGNFIAWGAEKQILTRCHVVNKETNMPYSDTPNHLAGSMVSLYKIYSIIKKARTNLGDTEKSSLRYVDYDGDWNRTYNAMKAIKDTMTSVDDIREYHQSVDGYYPEYGRLSSPDGGFPLACGPDAGCYNLVTLSVMAKMHKYIKEFEGVDDTTIKNSAYSAIEWESNFIYPQPGVPKYWVVADSPKTFCVRGTSPILYSDRIDSLARPDLQYWANYFPLADRIVETSNNYIVDKFLTADKKLFDPYSAYLDNKGNRHMDWFKSNFWWGAAITGGVRIFEDWKSPASVLPPLPCERYDLAPKNFIEMGPPGADQISGSLNGHDNPDTIVFHDGQYYRILMNYNYIEGGGGGGVGPSSMPTVTMRGYSSLQTTRPISNGDLNYPVGNGWLNIPSTTSNWLVSQTYNNHPNYWTSTGKVQYGGYIGYPYYSNYARLGLGITSTMSQDVYLVNGKPLDPNTKYSFSFCSKGLLTTSMAKIRWWTNLGYFDDITSISAMGLYNFGNFGFTRTPKELDSGIISINHITVSFNVQPGTSITQYTDIGDVEFKVYSGGIP
jgi:hypothetical protein